MNEKGQGMNGEENPIGLILNGLRERHGIDFSLYRQSTVERRLSRRMILTQCKDYEEYLAFLYHHPYEYDRLLKDLTIKVSRFFRNRPLFELLSDTVFPEIFAKNELRGEKSIRIWCAGCSHGEEAYSVVITLLEWMLGHGRNPGDCRISVFATDIDQDVLEEAKKGEYKAEALREADRELIEKYFTRTESDVSGERPLFEDAMDAPAGYRLIDPVRESVCFCVHDLVSSTQPSPPSGLFSNYDLILCRNVLIYFSNSLQDRAFRNLWRSLNPGGYLLLGRAETIPDSLGNTLIRVSPGAKVYRKV